MRIMALSDTHGWHVDLVTPRCDVLIYAGDIAGRTDREDTHAFLTWMRAQDAKHKIFVPGNHDTFYETHTDDARMMTEQRGITLLIDQGITIDGAVIWGSPYTPTFFDWSFMRDRGPEIRRHWDKIPMNTSVLVTHGPPAGVLDWSEEGGYAGCADLRERVLKVQPAAHIFGHIHEARGTTVIDGCKTKFMNVSSVSRGALFQATQLDLDT